MKIAVDFDGTVVLQDHHYDDLSVPLTFVPGAKDALLGLKAGGHLLLLWSGRSSRALLVDPNLDPFVRARGGLPSHALNRWAERRPIHAARFEQMVRFATDELPGVFDAIDDGGCGKPSVDLFIDDRTIRLAQAKDGVMGGLVWPDIRALLGAAVFKGVVDAQRAVDAPAVVE